MKSLLSRKQFFAALAAVVLVAASYTHARAQTKRGETVIAPPVITSPTQTQTPRDIPFGVPRSVETGPIKWQEFKSEAGGFSVKLPGAPRVEQVPFSKGPIKFNRYTHAVNLGNHFQFEVDYVDFPAGYNDPDLSLEGGISGLTRALVAHGATVLTKETITRGTCEGRDATLSLPPTSGGEHGFSEGRIFNSGQRYYFLLFVGDEDNRRTRDVARTFMESFAVADGCRAAIAPTVEPPSHKIVSFVEGTLDAATGWRRIENEELGFNLLMPGGVQHESEQGQVEPFPLMHHTYMREEEAGFYSAEVIGDYPPNFHSTPNSYDALIDVTVYSVKKRLEPLGFVFTPPRNLKLGAYPGREINISNEKAEAHGRMQIYVTPKRVYVFSAFVRGKDAPKANIERFFSSVRVSTR